VVAVLAYRPALWFNDAFEYVSVALHPSPYAIRPNGYSFFLQLLEPAHSFTLVVVVQHLMGLGTAVAVYALAHRFGLPPWARCLAALPVLLDGYWIQLEHTPLSDTLFTLLLVLTVVLVLWRPRPSVVTCTSVGLLLAVAMLVRPAALPMLGLLALYVAVRRLGWRSLGSLALAMAVPLTAYGLWYRSVHGNFALDNSTGIFLYGRVAGFADCRIVRPPPGLVPLCPYDPGNGLTAPAWVWHSNSPLYRVPGPLFSAKKEHLAMHFALRAIRAQPGDYAKAVGTDALHAFQWSRGPYPNYFTADAEGLRAGPWPVRNIPIEGLGTQLSIVTDYERGEARTRVVQPFAGWLGTYQDRVHLPGTVLALFLLLGAAGLVPRPQRGETTGRLPLLLLELAALSLVLVPILTVELDYRYVMPSYPFAAIAGVLGAARLSRFRNAGRRRL